MGRLDRPVTGSLRHSGPNLCDRRSSGLSETTSLGTTPSGTSHLGTTDGETTTTSAGSHQNILVSDGRSDGLSQYTCTGNHSDDTETGTRTPLMHGEEHTTTSSLHSLSSNSTNYSSRNGSVRTPSYYYRRSGSLTTADIDYYYYDEPLPPLPPDGGYGWMIVFASFIVNAVTEGVAYSFSILYVALLEHFQASPAKTAWIGALVPGFYLMTGPFASAVANRFGCRTPAVLGSVIAAFFFFISTFVNSVDTLIFTYGIMGGVGFGFLYLPSICIVSYYFDKKRALATGIAVCGSGVGTFVFPPLLGVLLKEYGWRGSLWFVSAIVLNCAVIAMFYRPLMASLPKRKKSIFRFRLPKIQRPKFLKRKGDMVRTPEIKRGTIMTKIIEQKERIRTTSTHSLDNTIITRDNQLVHDPELLKAVLKFEQEKLDQAMKDSKAESVPVPELTVHEENEPSAKPEPNSNFLQVPPDPSRLSSVAASQQSVGPVLSWADILVRKHLDSATPSVSDAGTVPPPQMRRRHMAAVDKPNSVITSREVLEERRREVSRPMYRQDIFYQGSVTKIPEYQSNPNMTSYVSSVTSIPNKTGGRCQPCRDAVYKLLDFGLFKSPTFALLCLNSFLAFIGFFTPFIYLPHHSMSFGVSYFKATFLVSLIGAFNTVGRVGAGWLADRSWADGLVIQNSALIVAGLASMVMPFIANYIVLAILASVFGLCVAAFIALRSVITAELLGVQRLTNAFGLILLFQGVSAIVGAPLAGIIFEVTKSYQVSFVISGVMLLLAGLVCWPARRVALWEQMKAKASYEDIEVVMDNDMYTKVTEEVT